MTRVYRILRKLYSKNPLNGEGAYHFGGRWSSPGTRLVYTSEHLSLAMIEYFIHVDPEDQPQDLVMITAKVPDNVRRASISSKHLPSNWRQSPAPPELAAIGDRFVRDGRAVILVVPSDLAPDESNWLVNPHHPEFPRIRLHSVQAFEHDARSFK